MAIKRIGKQSIQFLSPVVWISSASVVGPKEGQGPLREYFDVVLEDDLIGQESYEQAEVQLFIQTIQSAVCNLNMKVEDMQCLVGGDLLNQIVSTSFAARSLQIPYLGIYGACSNMTESMMVGAMMIDGGFCDCLVCATGSHFSTAERQYRFPLEMGGQRTQSAQWTVTGAGAAVLGGSGNGPRVTCATMGKVVDYGIKDASNMGAAMAPAAIDTLFTHFEDMGRKPEDYDLILTGDLGSVGSEVLIEKLRDKGYDIQKQHRDCGCEIFSSEQDVHAGGSGCGCMATVANGYLYKQLRAGQYRRVLLMATGALLSPTTTLQGESIPGIAHIVVVEG